MEIVLPTFNGMALMFYFFEMTGFSPIKMFVSVRFYDFIACLKHEEKIVLKKIFEAGELVQPLTFKCSFRGV